MSYILEALKKSQQERELGRVPTLDANLYPAPEAGVRTNPWSLAAVGLAMLAVIIALYAALRSDPLVPVVETAPGGSPKETASAATPSPSPPGVVASGPAVETGASLDGVGSDAAGRISDAVEPGPPVEPPLAPPPPRRMPPPEPRSAVDARIPPRPAGPVIPEDIRADVESFKDQVRGGRPAQPVRPAAAVPPEQLRLPPDVEARAPAFLMTVHVYDEDPAKRFVLINALKTKEGERTREGLVLEEVLPNGAVLSFNGHKFFRHR
ncbi:MAG: general secretion pathway protein GspB [Chromatiaceae bacterium]|nr:general secretion pathway protein GspB [Chromatiaceae bacterium]